MAAALLAMAFVLGRTTAHPPPAAPPVPVQAGQAPQPVAGPSNLQAPSYPPSTPDAGPAPAPERPQPPAPAKPGPDQVRAAVAAYFQTVDQVQPGQLGGDPEALARGILEGLMKGDSTGFDGMIRQTEEARANLAAVTPPVPCAGYHQESLAVLDDSLAMLRTVKGSLQGAGTGAPSTDFTAQASRLQARTETLQKQEQELRRRFSLGK